MAALSLALITAIWASGSIAQHATHFPPPSRKRARSWILHGLTGKVWQKCDEVLAHTGPTPAPQAPSDPMDHLEQQLQRVTSVTNTLRASHTAQLAELRAIHDAVHSCTQRLGGLASAPPALQRALQAAKSIIDKAHPSP